MGAGLGSNTAFMNDGSPLLWECIEPDPVMTEQLRAAVAVGDLPRNVTVECGTLERRSIHCVDTIIYIDVLEHIEDDSAEIHAAQARLEPGGHLIVLAPAHQWLYSPFDTAIGHYRRYSRRSLLDVAAPGLELVEAFYLDSAGLLASAANKLVLRASSPSAAQIAFWDNVIVRASQILDRLTFGRVGKTVVAVWRRAPPHPLG